MKVKEMVKLNDMSPKKIGSSKSLFADHVIRVSIDLLALCPSVACEH